MKKLLGCLLLMSMAIPALSQEKDATAPKPIQSLAWLVGGVWTADATKLGPGMQRIETRYSWSDNDAYLRFNTHFIFDKGTAKNYDGSLFWDPERKTLAMWYMDRANTVYEGPMEVTGDIWRIHFKGQDFEGKMAELQVQVTRKSNDLYHWSLQEKDGEKWKELGSLNYSRSGS